MSLVDAVGERLLFAADSGLGELDATDAESPELELHPTFGWGCQDAQVDGSAVYCGLGEFGLQTIALQ